MNPEDIANAYESAREEILRHNPAFRSDLVALLKKYELPALVAVDRLHSFCDEILCHFNTRDLKPFALPLEAVLRADDTPLRIGENVLHQCVPTHFD